jgi:hypothetical protein
MCQCIPMEKIQIQMLTHGYQDCLVPDVFQNIMSKIAQDMEYVETIYYLDDLLMLTYSSFSFKDHVLKIKLNGTHLINRPLIKLRKILELSY